jgi:hypothetical protein
VSQITLGFSEPQNIVPLSVPEKTAALQVDLLHLTLENNELDKGATRRRMQASDRHGWVFSAFVYPLDKDRTQQD